MRGQSHILQISNAIQELNALLEHLTDEQLVDLGASISGLVKSFSNESKTDPGLDVRIREHFKSLLKPPVTAMLLTVPAELKGGMFKAVLGAQVRPVFRQKDFALAYPVIAHQFTDSVTVPMFSYKPRG